MMDTISRSKYVLSNGIELPAVGFGTYGMENSRSTVKEILTALECGYRLIDTASIYNNEESIGEAVKKSKVKRSDIIISSKIWNSDKGYQRTLKAVDDSLAKLQMDHIDICLIHWPVSEEMDTDYKQQNIETWHALEQCYREGKVHIIGVSNFLQQQLQDLISEAEIRPQINQLEIHPKFQQCDLVDFCQTNGILVEGWGPLMHGKVSNVRLLNYLGNKYKKSPYQISIRWCLQREILPVAKASMCTHMLENLDVYDFELSDRDMELISDIDDRLGYTPFDLYEIQQKYSKEDRINGYD